MPFDPHIEIQNIEETGDVIRKPIKKVLHNHPK